MTGWKIEHILVQWKCLYFGIGSPSIALHF